MRAEPDHSAHLARLAAVYDELNNDDRSLAGRLTLRSHRQLEQSFGPKTCFSQVIEVGAGTGEHIGHVRHQYDRYLLTDAAPTMLQRTLVRLANADRVSVEAQNATRLTYANGTFDRLIACFVLEHLERPHLVLREWNRVVKPGGTISIALPCDPGIAWRLGRALGPRRAAARAGFIEYDYWMAREHINPCSNLVQLIRYYFDTIEESWFPALIPSVDINLFYHVNIRTAL